MGAYKKKDFATALSKYGKAIETDPNEITYYLNTAAVHFEMKNYAECISTCNKAIDVGRENRADFKHIAKALARMGNAYRKSGDFKNAKMAYEKALTEHRTPEYKLCLSEITVEMKKADEAAYVNPEIAEEEKQKGNELFKSGDFANAIKRYTKLSVAIQLIRKYIAIAPPVTQSYCLLTWPLKIATNALN